jgi:hypothetical protein
VVGCASAILLQFLVEAILVCVVGGLRARAPALRSWLMDDRTILGQVTADAVVLSLAVSIGIGVFFGFTLHRATRLRPSSAALQ